jgi:hypothetical protein
MEPTKCDGQKIRRQEVGCDSTVCVATTRKTANTHGFTGKHPELETGIIQPRQCIPSYPLLYQNLSNPYVQALQVCLDTKKMEYPTSNGKDDSLVW